MIVYEVDFDMSKNIRRNIIVALICSTIAMLNPVNIYGVAKVDISTPSQIKVGETITVTITYVDNEIGEIEGQLLYDESKLEYVSGGSNDGNSGRVLLNGNGQANSKAIFNVKFNVIAGGEDTLKVTTSHLYDIEENNLGAPSIEKIINILSENGTDYSATESDSEAMIHPIIVYLIGLVIVIVLLSVTVGVLSYNKKKKRKKRIAKERREARERAESRRV